MDFPGCRCCCGPETGQPLCDELCGHDSCGCEPALLAFSTDPPPKKNASVLSSVFQSFLFSISTKLYLHRYRCCDLSEHLHLYFFQKDINLGVLFNLFVC